MSWGGSEKKWEGYQTQIVHVAWCFGWSPRSGKQDVVVLSFEIGLWHETAACHNKRKVIHTQRNCTVHLNFWCESYSICFLISKIFKINIISSHSGHWRDTFSHSIGPVCWHWKLGLHVHSVVYCLAKCQSKHLWTSQNSVQVVHLTIE